MNNFIALIKNEIIFKLYLNILLTSLI